MTTKSKVKSTFKPKARSMAQKDKKVANPSDGRKYFLINTTLLPPIQGLKKLSYS